MENILHKSMVKGIKKEGGVIEAGSDKWISVKWAGARRAFLHVFADRLECGDWRIPIADIIAAKLLVVPYFFTHTYLLSVQTSSGLYQFGLSPSKFWQGTLPFSATKIKVKDGKFLVFNILRFAVVVWLLTFPPIGIPFLLYVIWLHFRK